MGPRTSHLVTNPMLKLQQACITSPTPWALQVLVNIYISIYMQQCPFVVFANIIVATIAMKTIGKLQVMAIIHSTFSLPNHQVTMA